ncbi:MauE/DoxX family redox-associated membrane protein [Paenibacillus harenae]|uniref:Membrane protein YphA (DoxX/SURF4 family) n=1 Tax=Paenibacillus harenae TaxID=306543 RepID=A0ABT9U9W7_PAEHA|nr:MauE/DoxX family redox-associated membrane protein [Paenibacillus harenae]MDQ0115495.1 putative membrane protein YphA (DoxX/SURF4 family) [Paenibacillus harenae]
MIPFLQIMMLITFLISGIVKVFGFKDFMKTIEGLKVHKRLILPAASSVVLLELTVPVLLFISKTQRFSYYLIVILLICFAWSIYQAYTLQLRVSCNCFGNINPELFGWNTVLRVTLLLSVTFYLLISDTTTQWIEYPPEDLLYAIVGSLGVLLIYTLLPYALFGAFMSKKNE